MMRSAWNTGGRIDDQMKLRCLSDNPWGDGTEYLREENAELKAENERLKTELEKYDWKTGEPEVAGEYWVAAQDIEGNLVYDKNVWLVDKNYSMWEYYGWRDDETGEPLSDVLAYAEIRPWKEQ